MKIVVRLLSVVAVLSLSASFSGRRTRQIARGTEVYEALKRCEHVVGSQR